MNKEKLKFHISEVFNKTEMNDQYEVLTSSQLGLISQRDYFNKQVASQETTGYKIINKGEFTYRSMSDTGLFFINRLDLYNIGIVSPAYPVFKVTSEFLNPEYLKIFFQSKNFQSQISTQSTGSTRLSLKYKKLSDVNINFPELAIQGEVVEIVHFLNKLIENQQKELKLFDELIKSRFMCREVSACC